MTRHVALVALIYVRHYAIVSKIHFVLPSVDCIENRVYLKQIIKSLDIVFSRSKTANLFAVCFELLFF